VIINDRKVKTIGVTLFAAVFGAPACCIPPNGYVSFLSRPSQIPLITVGVANTTYPCFQCQRSLNQYRRFLLLHSFKATCVHMAVRHFICLEAQTLAKKRFSFKDFFIAP